MELTTNKMKVAIIGASGIGKYHAQWFQREGCNIVGFLGRTDESVKETSNSLRKILGKSIRGYTNLTSLLLNEKPEIVVVATPSELHKEYVIDSLDYGAHVFCEKPLTWNEKNNIKQILEDGREMVAKAKKSNRFLGMNAQYVAAIPQYQMFKRKITGDLDKTINSFYFEMEARPNKLRENCEDLLIEVLAHPLSMLLAYIPGGNLKKESVDYEISKDIAKASFIYHGLEDPCQVEIICRNSTNSVPIRRFGFNDFIVDYVGRKENSEFAPYLINGKNEYRCQDFVQISIRQFLRAIRTGNSSEILVSGQTAYDNLSLQAEIYEAGKKTNE